MKLGLTDKQITHTISIFSAILSDLFVFQTKIQNYHWHVYGPHFGPLHEMFESFYKQTFEYIDQVAERIRFFGKSAPATLTEFLALTRIKECPGETLKPKEMLTTLAKDVDYIIQQLRSDIPTCEQENDLGGADLLTGMLKDFEKISWMLRIHQVNE